MGFFIIVCTAQPAPSQVEVEQINIEGLEYIRLSWNEVAGANSYRIYSSSDPLAEEWGEPIATVGDSIFTYPIPVDENLLKFFYITTIGEPEIPEGMVLVAGGRFNPVNWYTVTLSSYYIGKYEVRQSEYQSAMGVNPSLFGGNPNNPVDRVSWFNAVEYCNRLSIREGLTPCYSYTGMGINPANWPAGWDSNNNNHSNIACDWEADGYRLPTEMEWEFAARGGNETEDYTYSGSNDINEVAWWAPNSNGTTHPAGQKMPNELGIYDLSGNVFEWCWNMTNWPLTPYIGGQVEDPRGPATGTWRIGRGVVGTMVMTMLAPLIIETEFMPLTAAASWVFGSAVMFRKEH